MKIAIQPDKSGTESYSEKWAKFLQKRNVEVKWVDLTAGGALDQVKDCDGVMWLWAHIPRDKIKAVRILYTIEHYLRKPIFPDHNTCWHYDDKVAQYYLLQAAGVLMPQTWIFWDKDSATTWANRTSYPKVFKLSSGAGSSNVLKVSSKAEALTLIARMFDRGIFPRTMNEFEYKFPIIPRNRRQLKTTLTRIKEGLLYGFTAVYPPLPSLWWQPEKDYVYFQEFVPDNPYDTRITVIGNRAFGARRYNRSNDFRASGSGKADFDPEKIDLNCVKTAFELSKKLRFQSMAYDFLVKNGHFIVVEISYTFPDWSVKNFPGYWDPNLNWFSGAMWPEEAQVEDFIELIQKSKMHR